MELKTLKAYIENNLINAFIKPSKLPARIPIFFNRKPGRSLRLCVDYQDLNNLIIKNRYPPPLVGELLDQILSGLTFHPARSNQCLLLDED